MALLGGGGRAVSPAKDDAEVGAHAPDPLAERLQPRGRRAQLGLKRELWGVQGSPWPKSLFVFVCPNRVTRPPRPRLRTLSHCHRNTATSTATSTTTTASSTTVSADPNHHHHEYQHRCRHRHMRGQTSGEGAGEHPEQGRRDQRMSGFWRSARSSADGCDRPRLAGGSIKGLAASGEPPGLHPLPGVEDALKFIFATSELREALELGAHGREQDTAKSTIPDVHAPRLLCLR